MLGPLWSHLGRHWSSSQSLSQNLSQSRTTCSTTCCARPDADTNGNTNDDDNTNEWADHIHEKRHTSDQRHRHKKRLNWENVCGSKEEKKKGKTITVAHCAWPWTVHAHRIGCNRIRPSLIQTMVITHDFEYMGYNDWEKADAFDLICSGHLANGILKEEKKINNHVVLFA